MGGPDIFVECQRKQIRTSWSSSSGWAELQGYQPYGRTGGRKGKWEKIDLIILVGGRMGDTICKAEGQGRCCDRKKESRQVTNVMGKSRTNQEFRTFT